MAPPAPCVLCGTIVEMVTVGVAHDTPMGCLPIWEDARVADLVALMSPEQRPEGLILPNLCWRGSRQERSSYHRLPQPTQALLLVEQASSTLLTADACHWAVAGLEVQRQ